MARQADGKLIVAGSSNTTLNDFDDDFALVRYEADGTVDTTFGVDGMVLTDIGNADRLHALLVQPDGRIVAVGSTGQGGSVTLARYETDGTLDATFGVGGVVTATAVGASSSDAEGAALLPDGRILVAGGSRPATS